VPVNPPQPATRRSPSGDTPLLDELVAEELSPSRLDLRAEQLAGVEGANAGESHTLDQLRNQQRVANAKLARLYELMKDPDYPIEIAKAALTEEKAKLARIEAESRRPWRYETVMDRRRLPNSPA
jgi:hypothetical protein